eukprot:scaffold74104_cov16-Tisochrysis_lutea.AAC.1
MPWAPLQPHGLQTLEARQREKKTSFSGASTACQAVYTSRLSSGQASMEGPQWAHWETLPSLTTCTFRTPRQAKQCNTLVGGMGSHAAYHGDPLQMIRCKGLRGKSERARVQSTLQSHLGPHHKEASANRSLLKRMGRNTFWSRSTGIVAIKEITSGVLRNMKCITESLSPKPRKGYTFILRNYGAPRCSHKLPRGRGPFATWAAKGSRTLLDMGGSARRGMVRQRELCTCLNSALLHKESMTRRSTSGERGAAQGQGGRGSIGLPGSKVMHTAREAGSKVLHKAREAGAGCIRGRGRGRVSEEVLEDEASPQVKRWREGMGRNRKL